MVALIEITHPEGDIFSWNQFLCRRSESREAADQCYAASKVVAGGTSGRRHAGRCSDPPRSPVHITCCEPWAKLSRKALKFLRGHQICYRAKSGHLLESRENSITKAPVLSRGSCIVWGSRKETEDKAQICLPYLRWNT